MEQRFLNIWLQAQVLISEREGMIAENKQREHAGESMAYVNNDFLENARWFQKLVGQLNFGK